MPWLCLKLLHIIGDLSADFCCDGLTIDNAGCHGPLPRAFLDFALSDVVVVVIDCRSALPELGQPSVSRASSHAMSPEISSDFTRDLPPGRA